MIADKDRSFYFGASDTDKIIGRWTSDSFARWWLQKLGLNRDHFDTRYTTAGTNYEHRILESLGIPMEFDRQVILEDLRLRVNLDGNDADTNYECKTYQHAKGFRMPTKYIHQVQVQMFATGFRKTKIITYGLTEKEYDNYFLPIDPARRDEYPVEYDEKWVAEEYLPKLSYLSKCLKEGRFP